MERHTESSHVFDNIIEIHKSKEKSWYDMLTSFQLTYEYCSGISSEDFLNILMISPKASHYRTIPYSDFSSFNARPTHKHNFFELLIVLKGNTIQKIDGKEFMYSAGTCCLINRNLSHTEKFTEETKLLFIGLSTDFVIELLHSCKTSYFYQEKNTNDNFALKFMEENLFSNEGKSYLDFFPNPQIQNNIVNTLYKISESLIHAVFSPQFGSTYMVKGLICTLLQYLNNKTIYHHTLIKLNSDSNLLLFSRITHLLEDTDGRISRSELEKILNYNGSYLNSIVKHHTGMCIFDYGMTFCLKKAAMLLTSTNDSITSIAEKLHFSNRSHFYRLFKEKYGQTPKEYRDKYKIL